MNYIDRRRARLYILVHPDDCDPPHGLDLTLGGRDARKVALLAEAFARAGFDRNKPALMGYPKDGRIQLLSGTHRHEAARLVDMRLPVVMYMRSVVEAVWGTPAWAELIEDIPVKELEQAPVKEGGVPPGLGERVDLSNGLWWQ